jgi:hypothetical protein
MTYTWLDENEMKFRYTVVELLNRYRFDYNLTLYRIIRILENGSSN